MPNTYLTTHHVNTEGEILTVEQLVFGPYAGQWLLVVHDDPPPSGTGIRAPMLLDRGTRDALRRALDIIDEAEENGDA